MSNAKTRTTLRALHYCALESWEDDHPPGLLTIILCPLDTVGNRTDRAYIKSVWFGVCVGRRNPFDEDHRVLWKKP